MDIKFGLIGRLTEQQKHREHFQDIPVGELFMILNGVELPAYDALVIFPHFMPKILDNGERHYTGYVLRGTYEIIGNIFDNPELLIRTGKFSLKHLQGLILNTEDENT